MMAESLLSDEDETVFGVDERFPPGSSASNDHTAERKRDGVRKSKVSHHSDWTESKALLSSSGGWCKSVYL